MKGPKFVFAALVAAAILVSPAPAGAEPPAEMNKAIEKLDKAIANLEAVERSLTNYKTQNSAAVRQVQDDVASLKTRISYLEDEIRALRQQVSAPSSISRRIDIGELGSRLGRVRLVNDYSTEMSVVVNGVAYRLLPGESRTVTVAPGTFTYQILQLQGNVQERSIAPDEQKYIRIFPSL